MRPYWRLAEAATRVARTESEWAEGIREHVKLAADARMMSDVPVGVFLSGGIDSSTALALIAQGSGRPVETFSVGFRDNPAYNEFHYARLAAERFGANHHEVVIGHEDMIEYRHLARGLSNQEIAARVHLSPHTVKDHLDKIRGILDVRSRAEVVTRL